MHSPTGLRRVVTNTARPWGRVRSWSGILVSVSKQEDPILSARAMALLGSIKLQIGHTLNHICGQAQEWYNRERGHSARDNLPPDWRSEPEELKTIKLSDVICTTRLGGLLKSYARRAA